MQHKFEWMNPSPFYAYTGFKWNVFNSEQAKMNHIVPLFYSLPKGMFSKFLVNYINWIRKNGTYEELINLAKDCYGEDYPDWLYYELSVIDPNQPITYFTYINIFTKAVYDSYKTYEYVYQKESKLSETDKLRNELKEKLLSTYSSVDSLSEEELKDLQKSFLSFVN